MLKEYEKIEMLLSFTALMQDYGFTLIEKGNCFTYEFASGSIANYNKIRITRPHFAQSSFADVIDDYTEYLIAYVCYEDFSESGEWECDRHTIMERTMKAEDIISFLKEKGFRTHEEREMEKAERIARLNEMRAIANR